MTNFDALLSKPLPSASRNGSTYMEGANCGNCKEGGGECGMEGGSGCGTEGGNGCGTEGAPTLGLGEDDPIANAIKSPEQGCDPNDPMCKPDMAALGKDPLDDTPVAAADTGDVELSPDESRRVDDTLNAVATPLLLQSEMTEEEYEEFVESADSDIALAEGLITERTIVKFDKHARRAQLMEVAVAACAREKKDPLYKKLQTVYKMERIIKAKLRVKYNAPASRKVKEYLARAKKSKSGIISRIVSKITKK